MLNLSQLPADCARPLPWTKRLGGVWKRREPADSKLCFLIRRHGGDTRAAILSRVVIMDFEQHAAILGEKRTVLGAGGAAGVSEGSECLSALALRIIADG
jgi:hypothetical protein